MIRQLRLEAEIDALEQLPAITCKTWDFATQSVVTAESQEPGVNNQGNLPGTKLSDVLGLDTFGLQSFGNLVKRDLEDWANAQLLKSRLARIRGKVTMPGNVQPKPGQSIKLDGLGARFDGDAFVRHVTHHIVSGDWTTTAGFGLPRLCFTDDHGEIEVPLPPAGLQPGALGLQIATVQQIHEDPLGQRRIKVRMPLADSKVEGIWIRLASPYATRNAGMFFMPEIDDEVVFGFLDDDANSPIVLGRLHSSSRKTPYEPEESNTTKAIVSNSQMKIHFDDVNKTLVIETPGGHMVTLSDEKQSITISDSNKNEIEMNDGGIRLESPTDITVSARGSVQIKGDGGISLETASDFEAKSLNATIKAQVGLTVKGDSSAEIGSVGTMTVKGAMVLIN